METIIEYWSGSEQLTELVEPIPFAVKSWMEIEKNGTWCYYLESSKTICVIISTERKPKAPEINIDVQI